MRHVLRLCVLLVCFGISGFSEDEMQGSRILKIALLGNPVLASVAQKVEDPTAPQIRRLVEDMMVTAIDKGDCAGLAAPQVHVPLRIVLIYVPKEKNEDVEIPLTALINPEWEPLSQEQTEDLEGCLSMPGLMGPVPRYTKIRYTFQTLEGERVTREVSGFHARVVQHECDHLEGRLYISRMKDVSRLAFVEEVAKQRRKKPA